MEQVNAFYRGLRIFSAGYRVGLYPRGEPDMTPEDLDELKQRIKIQYKLWLDTPRPEAIGESIPKYDES